MAKSNSSAATAWWFLIILSGLTLVCAISFFITSYKFASEEFKQMGWVMLAVAYVGQDMAATVEGRYWED